MLVPAVTLPVAKEDAHPLPASQRAAQISPGWRQVVAESRWNGTCSSEPCCRGALEGGLKRDTDKEEKDDTYYTYERSYGSFSRSFAGVKAQSNTRAYHAPASTVPEPTPLVLLLACGAGFFYRHRRRVGRQELAGSK